MRHTGQSLLPRDSTAYEVAESLTSAEFRDGIPYEDLPTVFDPWTCPARLLPWLAYTYSVDLWSNDWPENKKRRVIAMAVTLHRLKGTLAGITAYADFMGGEVLRAITPPGRGHLKGAITGEALAAWLESLPYIRIYPFLTLSTATRRHFANGPGGTFFHGSGWLRSTRGRRLVGKKAEYRDGATVIPAAYEATVSAGATAVETVLIGSTVKRRSFYGHSFSGQGWLRTTRAPSLRYSLAVSADAGQFPVPPGSVPVDVRPVHVFERRIAPAARSFCGRFHGTKFLKTSHGPYLIWDRIALLDPTRAVRRRKVRDFHGYGRMGMPAFNAELRISIPMHRPLFRACRFHGAGYRQAANMQPLWDVVEAVHIAKSRRDVIRIDTATRVPVAFNSALRFGEFSFGDLTVKAR